MVGFASYRAETGDKTGRIGELIAIYIHPDRWRQGVGRGLWHHVERSVAEDFDEVILWVLDWARDAIELCYRIRASDSSPKEDTK